MATEIFYPATSHEEINFEDLLNVANVRAMLQVLKTKGSTNSTSKIKNIKYYELFIKYITKDISSPEYSENMTNEQLITQDIKLKSSITKLKLL